MAENQQKTDSPDLDSMIAQARASQVNDLATRLAAGAQSPEYDSIQKNKSLFDSVKDVAAPALGGVVSSLGSIARVAGGGPGGQSNPLTQAGDYLAKTGQDLQSNVSTEKQVRDQANQIENKTLESQGDYLGAAVNAAKYKMQHGLETTGELAGGMAVPIAATMINPVLGGAAWATSTSGNTADAAYKKIMSTPDNVLASVNPDFASNPTPENKERIAKAEAFRSGTTDAAINTVGAFLGPAGQIAGSLGKRVIGDAGANMIRFGVDKVAGGGLTNAAKIAAANGASDLLKGVGKDIGAMAAQSAATTVNENYTDTMVDPHASLTDNLATAVGASIPAGAAMGYAAHKGKVADAKKAVEAADAQHLDPLKDLMASQDLGANRDQTIGAYVNSLPEYSGNDKAAQRADLANYLSKRTEDGKFQAEVDSTRDQKSSDLVDQAKSMVDEGKATDYQHAIDLIQNGQDGSMADHGMSDYHFDQARAKAKEIQDQADQAAKEQADQAKQAADAKAKADADTQAEQESIKSQALQLGSLSEVKDYLRQNGVADNHGQEFADSVKKSWQEKQTSDKQAAKDKAIEEATKTLDQHESISDFTDTAKANGWDKAIGSEGFAQLKKQVKDKIAERAEKKRADEAAKAQQEGSAKEQARIASESDISSKLDLFKSENQFERYARENGLYDIHGKDKIKLWKMDIADRLASEKEIADQAKAEKVSASEIQVEKDLENIKTPLEFAKYSKENDLVAIHGDKKVQEWRSEISDRLARQERLKEKQAAESIKTEGVKERKAVETQAFEAKKAIETKASMLKTMEARLTKEALGAEDKEKFEKANQAIRDLQKSTEGRSKIQTLHEIVRKAYEDAKAKGLDILKMSYDIKGLKEEERSSRDKIAPENQYRDWKTAMYHDLHDLFPADRIPGSEKSTARHAMHLMVVRELSRLAAQDAAPKFRTVKGNIQAHEGVSPERVVAILKGMKEVPAKAIGKALLISRNIEEAFGHDPERLAAMREQLDGRNPAGLFDAKTGELHLFADHLSNDLDVQRTVLHEVTHRGLDAVLSGEDKASYEQLCQKIMNGNAAVRRFTNELIQSGRLKANDSPMTKLHETLAYIGEDLSHFESKITQNAVQRVVAMLRQFAGKILSKISPELGSKFLDQMSDREVMDAVRKITNKGFESLEAFKGDRATTFENGEPRTDFLFRSDPVEVEKWTNKLARWGDKNDGVMGHLAIAISKIPESLGDISKFEAVRTIRSLAESDKTGQIKAGYDAAAKAHRMAGMIENYLLHATNAPHLMSMLGPDAASIVKGATSAFKFDQNYGRLAKMIGQHLIERMDDGNMKLQSAQDIERILKSKGVSDKDIDGVKKMYGDLTKVSKSIAEIDAKSQIAQMADFLLHTVGEKQRKELEKLRLDHDSMNSRSVDDYLNSFKAIDSAIGKDSQLAKSFRVLAQAAAKRANEAEKFGNLPLHREGKHSLSVFRVETLPDGQVKKTRVEYHMRDGKAQIENVLADLKKEGKYNDASKFEIKQEVEGELKGSKESYSSLAADLDAIRHDKTMTEQQKEAAMSDLMERRGNELADEITKSHMAEANAAKVVSGFDPDIGRAVLKKIHGTAQLAGRRLGTYDMTQAIANAEGMNRQHLLKMAKNMATEDDAFVKGARGLTYTARIGGSIASAAIQHLQQYILGAPLLASYVKDGSGFVKSQLAIAKASADLAIKGIDGIKDPKEKAFLQGLMEKGYVQHSEGVMAQHYVADQLAAKNNALGALAELSSSFMTVAELNNKLAAHLAAYRMFDGGGDWQSKVKNADKLGFSKFEDFSNKIALDAHFDSQKYNRSALERSAVGLLFSQFHMFPVRMVESIALMPMKQKAQAIAMLTLLAGANNLPFAQNIEDLVDAVSTWSGNPINSKEMARRAVSEVLGESAGESLMGGVGRLANIEIGQRVGMGDILPFTSMMKLTYKDASSELMKEMGPSMAYLSDFFGAAKDVAQGKYRGALMKTAPTALVNLYKGAEIAATGEQRDSQGMTVRKDVGIGEAVARGLGFGSFEAQKLSRASDELQQMKEAHDFMSARFMNDYMKARKEGDSQGMHDVMQKVNEYNKDKMMTPGMINVGEMLKAANLRVMGMSREAIDRQIMMATGNSKMYWMHIKNEMGAGK